VLDRSEFDRWRAAADGARRSAELQAREELHNWGCFLAEQGAQLAVKGLLHGLGTGAWGHDLTELGRALAEATEETLPEEVAAALRRLSRHYIPARDPDAHPSGPPDTHYGREDSQHALADLRTILGYVDALWSRLSDLARGDANGD
jgi:HEPN domain-containing protein